MHDCDYCGESFQEERPYLKHLRDQHASELGTIDRRRVKQLERGGGSGGLPTGGTLAVAAGLAIVAIAAAYLLFFSGGGGGADAKALNQQGDRTLLSDVQTFESEGRQHLSTGTNVEYQEVPPVSGDHWGPSQVRRAGFYEEEQPYEALVHNLEHGHVVIYYDPAAITPDVKENLKAYASRYSGSWASVVVVPNPQANPEAPYVLTAWRTKLTMDSYDEDTLVAFLSEYLGRGPENPVR